MESSCRGSTPLKYALVNVMGGIFFVRGCEIALTDWTNRKCFFLAVDVDPLPAKLPAIVLITPLTFKP